MRKLTRVFDDNGGKGRKPLVREKRKTGERRGGHERKGRL
nr:MAG TPA: hypothetical protein [Bacteriophage sp.]